MSIANRVGHLGIIIDGNRRYAKAARVSAQESYMRGAEKVYEIVRYVFERTSIPELTIYALSYDNLVRGTKELGPIIEVQERYFNNWYLDPFFEREQVRVRFVGQLDMLPKSMRESCLRLQAKTANHKRRTLNMLVAYTAHLEIAETLKKIATSGMLITKNSDAEKLITENLIINRPVDIVIRTSGENRLSGFLLWQAEYAELYSIKKTWPEITTEDVQKVLEDYKSKELKRGI